jgi:large subunit ribosomal protein L16
VVILKLHMTKNVRKNTKKRKKQKQLHIPKFIKFKKFFQGKMRGTLNYMNYFSLQYGHIGLQAVESGYLTLLHYDLLKKFLSPVTKNSSHLLKMTNLWIKFFTDRTMSQKPLQSRMGRGKGLPTIWYSKIYAGQIIVEISARITFIRCMATIRLLIKKIPLLTRIVVKADKNQSTIQIKNQDDFDSLINKKSLAPLQSLQYKKLAKSTNQLIYIR